MSACRWPLRIVDAHPACHPKPFEPLASGDDAGRALWRRLALPLAAILLVQIAINVALLSVAVLPPLIAPDLGVPTARAGLFIGLAYPAGAITGSGAGRLLAPIGPMTGSLVALAATVTGLVAAVAGAPEDASTVSAGAMVFTSADVVAGPPRFGLVVEPLGGYPAGFAGAAAVAVVAPASAGRRPRVQEETSDGDPCDHR